MDMSLSAAHAFLLRRDQSKERRGNGHLPAIDSVTAITISTGTGILLADSTAAGRRKRGPAPL